MSHQRRDSNYSPQSMVKTSGSFHLATATSSVGALSMAVGSGDTADPAATNLASFNKAH